MCPAVARSRAQVEWTYTVDYKMLKHKGQLLRALKKQVASSEMSG